MNGRIRRSRHAQQDQQKSDTGIAENILHADHDVGKHLEREFAVAARFIDADE